MTIYSWVNIQSQAEFLILASDETCKHVNNETKYEARIEFPVSFGLGQRYLNNWVLQEC